MATIILRDAGSISSPGSTAKGSPLTNLEVDNNFSNINVTLGVLTNLATTAQSNLVVAINEIKNGNLRQFASTTSAELAAVLSNETGTGNVVFSTSPVLTTPALGTPSSGILSSCTVDGTDSVGFLNVPQNSQSASYTTVLADAGKVIFHPAADANARTFTIAANASVAYPIGTVIAFANMTSQVVTIAINSDTMYLGGTGTTGSRSLAQYGIANALKITSTNWIITGTGLT